MSVEILKMPHKTRRRHLHLRRTSYCIWTRTPIAPSTADVDTSDCAVAYGIPGRVIWKCIYKITLPGISNQSQICHPCEVCPDGWGPGSGSRTAAQGPGGRT
ncbi:hypothetical protein GDO81_017564 [Engystomops pustulosus]|uniref:Uncharacterized protein n=1 Tax=Engystomops pustulosus TaxID=76066 RepID=A0AAV7A2U1_ENGPU|nr:hypothetical protein GDO81_017564 [Engystomops pustulosus]